MQLKFNLHLQDVSKEDETQKARVPGNVKTCRSSYAVATTKFAIVFFIEHVFFNFPFSIECGTPVLKNAELCGSLP